MKIGLRIFYDDFSEKVKNIHDEMEKHHSYKKKRFFTLFFHSYTRPLVDGIGNAVARPTLGRQNGHLLNYKKSVLKPREQSKRKIFGHFFLFFGQPS